MNAFALQMTRKEFHDVFSRVAPAMNTEETRYYLNGAYLHRHEASQQLVLVATDGHRLHRVIFHAATEGDLPERAIIPRELIAKAIKAVPKKGEAKDYVRLTIREGKHVEIALTADTTYRGELIGYTYPDYQRVIPKPETPYFGQFNIDYLMDVCKAAKAGGQKYLTLRADEPRRRDDGSLEQDFIRDPMLTHDPNGGTYVLMSVRADNDNLRRIREGVA